MVTRRIACLSGLATLAACAAEPPPPVPERFAGFAGRWRGIWDNLADSTTVLTVDRISPSGEVTGTYIFRQAEPLRFQAQIVDNAFYFGASPRFTFTLRPDGRLAGERVSGAVTNRTLLTRG